MIASLRRLATPFHLREAALCFPALPILIGGGLALGDPVLAATLAGAAFAVGFGAGRGLSGWRWRAMLVPLFGMPTAAFVGCLAAQDFTIFVIIACILGAGVAALALFDEDWWWMVLQMVITYLVSIEFAGGFAQAAWRAAAVLGGGLGQFAMVITLARAFKSAARPYLIPLTLPAPTTRQLAAHMTRAAASVGGSIIIARFFSPASIYWAPMTALLVLKPGLLETRVRGAERMSGTLIGCLAATIYAVLCHNDPRFLTAGTSICAVAAFALQKASYAVLTTAITFTIVLLNSIGQIDALTNAEHRVTATVIGGGLAFLVALLFTASGRRKDEVDRVGPDEADSSKVPTEPGLS